MAVNGFTTGKDRKLVVVTPEQGVLVLAELISFKWKETPEMKKVMPMSGGTKHLRFEEGGEGTITIERKNNTLEAYLGQRALNYAAGEDVPPLTILETITEEDGSQTQWRFTNIVLGAFDGGDSAGDNSQKQELPFMYSDRLPVQ